MATVNFITPAGGVLSVAAEVGKSVMQAAVKSNIPGIIAECGGTCSCATCHVYVDKRWLLLTGEPGLMETAMLEFTENVREESRLSCQIRVTPDMDGLTVRVPESGT